jgi:hypothetical protein
VAESPEERLNRELIELLNELRVALPGVQVLFAFLLTVPFTQRFAHVTTFQRDLYFGTLLASALATALLIAPSAIHRLEFRQHDKGQIVEISNRLTIVGLGFLALAMTGVVVLITDVLFGSSATIAVGRSHRRRFRRPLVCPAARSAVTETAKGLTVCPFPERVSVWVSQ